MARLPQAPMTWSRCCFPGLSCCWLSPTENSSHLQVRQIPGVLTTIFVQGTGDIKGCNPNISKEEEKPPRGTEWGPGRLLQNPCQTPLVLLLLHPWVFFPIARGFQQTALPETWLESEAAAWTSLGPSGGLFPLNPGQCSHRSIHQLCGTYQLFPRWWRQRKHFSGRTDLNGSVPAHRGVFRAYVVWMWPSYQTRPE